MIVQLRQQLAATKGDSSSSSAAAATAGKGKGKGKAENQDDEPGGAGADASKKEAAKGAAETPLARVVRDATKLSSEASHGLIGALVKDALFNGGKLAGGVDGKGEQAGALALPPVVL